MDTILNRLERHAGVGACLSGDVSFAQATMNDAKAEIERLRTCINHLVACGLTAETINEARRVLAGAVEQ